MWWQSPVILGHVENLETFHAEQFPDINKLCNVASCWIYTYIGILLGAHTILHISRIKVKDPNHSCHFIHCGEALI
jgi:hypothetical protein